MAKEAPRYIDVDSLLAKATLCDAAAAYGFPIEEGMSEESRIECPFQCEHATGRPISINIELPHKPFLCHAYQCGIRGNLLALMYGFKHGTHPPGGRLKGSEFKAIARDLQRIVEGESPEGESRCDRQSSEEKPPAKSKADTDKEADTDSSEMAKSKPPEEERNVPLKDSPNERARALVNLDEHFVTDVASMSPAAAAYIRKRQFLTPEVMQKWRCGYLPQDSKGLLRGRIVYPFHNEAGDVLTWFGRDPGFDKKHSEWKARGCDPKKEPIKMKFVKGFHRGQELFGQHASRLKEPELKEAIAEYGVIVVEGPNDVIALDTLGIPAVGLCSTQITAAQARKVAAWAKQLGDGLVTVMLDCDDAGVAGAKETIWALAQLGLRVQLGWSKTMHDGGFADRQPESLSVEEWGIISDVLSKYS